MDIDTRTALGQAYKRWLRANNFSQQVSHDWAKAVGSEGPWNSQVSLFTQSPCKLDPKSGYWVSLGRFNAAIAAQDFAGITSRTLMDKLKVAKPFTHDDGELVTATDFYGMFIGEVAIPEAYAVTEREWTEEEAAAESARLREAFKSFAQEQMLSPAEAWGKVAASAPLPARQQARLKEILSGWAEFEPAELADDALMAACKTFTGA